ncbi:MAG: hypothetical protein O3C20_01710 [Verrucomicrobia bacterium]|nr:hypothetical protein [Verrucomicrobiota bacterium]
MNRSAIAALLSFSTFLVGQGGERSVDFVNDVMPVLSRFDCNMSACHGKAEGQNGFKLSVFGNDPRADFEAISMNSRGRRVVPPAPEASLLLRKASGDMPHEGGSRLEKDSPAYRILARWIGSGMKWQDPARPAITRLRIDPPEKVLGYRAEQPLRVIAEYGDGTSEDVTWLSVFHTNNEAMASVTEEGKLTTGTSTGQAAVMARYQGKVAVFRALVPRLKKEDEAPFPGLPHHNEIKPPPLRLRR